MFFEYTNVRMTAAHTYRDLIERSDGPPRHPGRRMTEAEFVDWCDESTWAEWVNGEVILMSPVNFQHAEIFSFLHHLIGIFAEDNDLGTVLTEPFHIRFGELRRRRSPDIFFVSRERTSLFAEAHFEGGPDLIVEIVSPDSQSRDRREKYMEYCAAGVREYWIIDPGTRTLEAHALVRGHYKQIIEKDGRIDSTVLKGFFIKPEWLWRIKLPKVSDLLRQIRKSRRGGKAKS